MTIYLWIGLNLFYIIWNIFFTFPNSYVKTFHYAGRHLGFKSATQKT